MTNSVNNKNQAPESELDEAFQGDVRIGRLITSVPRATAAGLAFIPGLIFLVAGRAAGHVGVNAVTATVLVTFALLLTLLNIFELLGGSSARGGTSSLVYESLGGRSGFITGWSLIAAYIVLYAAMAQLMARLLRELFPTLLLTHGFLGVGIILILSLIQIFRILPRQGSTLPTVILIFSALAGLMLAASPTIDSAFYQNPPFMESGDLMRTAGWLIVMFGGLEAVMASRRLIQDPGRNAPSSLLWTLMISGLTLAAGLFLASGLPSVYAGAEPQLLSEVIRQDSSVAGWVIAAISLGGLLLSLNTGLMTAARQLHMLTRWGALPRNIIAVRRPFRLPPLIFVLLAILAAPLIFLVPLHRLMDMGSVFMFVPVVLVNLSALVSRRSEPDRRRPFLVPYYPLAPLVAMAITVGMLFALPQQPISSGFLWLLPGFVFYEVYSRSHLIQAQEGVRVFGRSSRREKKEDSYRILVPFIAGAERRVMYELATALASQLQGELIALQVVVIPDPLAVEEGQRLAEERNTLFQWSTRFTAKSDVPTYPITRLARSVHEGILQTAVEEDCDLIFLSWALGDDPSSARLGRVLDPVIRAATSDVVVFAFQPEAISKKTKGQESTRKVEGEKSLPIDRILVTTAGGPHAPLASNLALLLARAYGATTSGVYIAEPDASQEVLAEGQARIQKTLEVMRQQAAQLPGAELREQSGTELAFEGRVIRAESVLEGIVQAGIESNLVLIGASEESLIDQVLFGTLPEEVARSCPTPVLMVKRYRGLRRFWLQRLWSTIAGMLPSLSGSERIEVYRRVRRNARPDVDFFFMMGLSAIIASYGLLQDSSAVIIGGMLVAPLFTPILAVSIAVVRGDIQLLRLAIESALKGIVLTIGVAIFITAISPLRNTGSEILSRVSPDLFDLAVALASGAAGAYAIARKDVAASLPGVAIAAALVPPLCVVGVGLALTDAQIAGGAALLFLTNLVAIVLAGSVTLLLIGFRPADRDEREARLRVGLTATLVLLILITVPLAIVFARAVEDSNTRRTINRVLLEHIGANPEMEMLDFNFTKKGSEIEVTLYAPETPSSEVVNLWNDDLSSSLDKSVHLQLVVIPVSRVESSQP